MTKFPCTNVQTLKKNITIPEHDDLNNSNNHSNFTNNSANNSKNFNPNVGGSSINSTGSNMNIPGGHSTNTLPQLNKNLPSSSTNSYGSFQPVAFAAPTPLNNNMPPVISGASLCSNSNVLPPQQIMIIMYIFLH